MHTHSFLSHLLFSPLLLICTSVLTKHSYLYIDYWINATVWDINIFKFVFMLLLYLPIFNTGYALNIDNMFKYQIKTINKYTDSII